MSRCVGINFDSAKMQLRWHCQLDNNNFVVTECTKLFWSYLASVGFNFKSSGICCVDTVPLQSIYIFNLIYSFGFFYFTFKYSESQFKMKRAMSENNSEGEDNMNDGGNNLSGGSNASGNYSNNNNRGQKRSRNEEMIRLLIPSRVSRKPFKFIFLHEDTKSTAKWWKTFLHCFDFSKPKFQMDPENQSHRKMLNEEGRELSQF